MKTNTSCLALLTLLAGLSTAFADSVQPVADKPELLALLRANYVDFDKLPRKDADLSGLIAQSKGGLSVAPVAASNVRMFSVVLPGNVVYWRAGSFTPETSWHALATEANQAGSPGMVVDLRSNTTPDDYDGAMKVAAFMAPGQTGLVVHGVSLSAPAPAPETLRGQPTIVVLTDHETCGAAEALAACLKSHGALVMGEATQGKAAIFKQVSLTSGSVLRYATAHVYLADGTDLWDRPVQPDVTTTTDTKAEQTALAMIDENQVQSVIGEANERHRMSEAALVQGQDPEQDQFLESREKNAVAAPSAPVTRDVALVEAIDSLKAIHVLQGQDLGNSTNVAVR